MADVTCRLARRDEIERLQQIYVDADQAFAVIGRPELVDEPYPAGVLDAAVERKRINVAVDANDRPIGFVFVNFGGPEPCIGQISVDPDAGRSGIGSGLLEHAIAQLAAADWSTVVLNTERDVAWNAPWYERHGFSVVPPAEWTDDMRVITAEQTAEGLDWSTRVHMRRHITVPVD